MSKKILGGIAVIFGGLLLSLELYCLKFFYLIDPSAGSIWKNSTLDYLKEPNIIISLSITLIVIILGFILLLCKERK